MFRNPPRPHPLGLALLVLTCLAAASARTGADSYPIEVESETLDGSPFQIAIESAEAIEEDDGTLSLKLDYVAETLHGETLAVQGITLLIYNAEGDVKGSLSIARSAEISVDRPGMYSYTIGASELANLELSDRLVVTTSTSTSARCYQSNESMCDNADFLCSAWCNNPLGGNRGVRTLFCGDCTQSWSEELDCWVETCHFSCQCNDVPWPDQRTDYTDWFEQEPRGY